MRVQRMFRPQVHLCCSSFCVDHHVIRKNFGVPGGDLSTDCIEPICCQLGMCVIPGIGQIVSCIYTLQVKYPLHRAHCSGKVPLPPRALVVQSCKQISYFRFHLIRTTEQSRHSFLRPASAIVALWQSSLFTTLNPYNAFSSGDRERPAAPARGNSDGRPAHADELGGHRCAPHRRRRPAKALRPHNSILYLR